MDKYGSSEVLLGLHKLIVFKYDYVRLKKFVEKYLRCGSGDTWKDIAKKVSLLGQWDFEGYRLNR
jgi:hypothetical protein